MMRSFRSLSLKKLPQGARWVVFVTLILSFAALALWAMQQRMRQKAAPPNGPRSMAELQQQLSQLRARTLESKIVSALVQDQQGEVTRLIVTPVNEREREDALRSLLTYLDTAKTTEIPARRLLPLISDLATFIRLPNTGVAANELRFRQRARIFAARVLQKIMERLAPAGASAEDVKAAGKALDSLLKKTDRNDDAYALVLQAAMHVSQPNASNLDKLKRMCREHDTGKVRECLMSIAEIPDREQRAAMLKWMRSNMTSFQAPFQPLIFRIAVSNRDLLEERASDALLEMASKKQGEDWYDAFLSAVAETRSAARYRDRIEWIAANSAQPTVRMRAHELIAKPRAESTEGL